MSRRSYARGLLDTPFVAGTALGLACAAFVPGRVHADEPSTPANAGALDPAAVAEHAPADDPELGDSELAHSGLLGDEQALFEERYGYPDRRRRTDPYEEPDRSYWFFGASYRHAFLPSGIVELFAQDAPSMRLPSFAIELTRRRNDVELITSLYYTDYSFEGPFRGSNDTVFEYERFDSSLATVGVGVTVLWGTTFSDVFSLQYGFALGLGATFGELRRTEAYPSQNGGFPACVGPTAPGQPGTEQPGEPFDPTVEPGSTLADFCGVPNDQNPAGGYTDLDGQNGEHYGIRERGLLNGGSVPFFSMRLAPQISLRIKPIHQLAFRVDAGFDLFSGIYLGGGVAYGF